jgi:hypothetical protein
MIRRINNNQLTKAARLQSPPAEQAYDGASFG